MNSVLRRLAVFALGAVLLSRVQAGTEVIAHRGAMKLAPENTLASQRLAYELGADYVEVDVRLTKDLIPVNLHDPDLDRTTDGTGLLYTKTLAEVKALDAGSWFGAKYAGERVPTIAENLELARQYNRKILLDIKLEGMAPVLTEVIRNSGISLNQIAFLLYSDSMVTSYVSRLPGVRVLREPVSATTGTGVTPDKATAADLDKMRRMGVTSLLIYTQGANKRDTDRFHAAGLEVSALYHPQADAYYYGDMGVDLYWTDYADVTMSVVNRNEQQWNNWAEAAGLAPDQRYSWMDPDEDGQSNLMEFALGTDPLTPGTPPSLTRLSPATVGWTLNMRENWSEFILPSVQQSDGNGWVKLPASSLKSISPTQLQFEAPITGGKRFYRMMFEFVR